MSERTSLTKIYNTQFWLVCLSSFFFFASFNMIIPELPAYLTTLGGEEYKGLIIGLFTLTALLSRPISGKLADTVGRVPVMMFGSIVCLLCGFLYPILSSIAGFLLLRLAHGFSTGFTPTGKSAYLSDVIPIHKRGEAMGIFGTAGSLGMAGGLALGSTIATHFSLNAMFYTSSFIGVLSIVVILGVKETLPHKQRFRLALLKINKNDLFEKRVIVPCTVMVLTAYAYGTFLTILPDYAEHLGIQNKGPLFTAFTMASLVVRLLAGRASDKFGRKNIILISASIMCAALLIIGLSGSALVLLIGIVIYGLGHGMTSPTLLAWAADLSDENHKGKGLSSLYMFMEFGIGIGAVVSAEIYGNYASNFAYTFIASSALCLAAVIFLIFVKPPHVVSS